MADLSFTIDDIILSERIVRFRMPFRYGVVTLREAPEAHVTARISLSDGRSFQGSSADLMAPKWFDKNPELSNDQNFEQLRTSILLTAERYLADRTSRSAFAHHAHHDAAHYAACAQVGLNGLVAGFGTAMADRAILDACCHATDMSFAQAVRANLPGITAQTAPDLNGFDIAGFLQTLAPADQITVRHTVGLTDAITDDQIPKDDGENDGLPRSLQANCQAYGLRAFKLKVSGDIAADIERLNEIASVLDRLPHSYLTTLDGNEQFQDTASFSMFWNALADTPALARLRASIAFVEQPMSRQMALSEQLGSLGERLPIEIDESDADINAFATAATLGYRGVSSKSCKGVYRSLLNRCRVEKWNAEAAEPRFFMSAEDLSTQVGTALQQDLSLATLIGCEHVERNGHQYGDGLSGGCQDARAALQAEHPNMYRLDGYRANLIIADGQINIFTLK